MSSPAAGAHPPLPLCLKGRYPFALAVPSFVYPDHYLQNVRALGPFVDEIELLMFESRFPDSLPGPNLIDGLGQAGEELGLTFNIHLPTDVDLADPDPDAQGRAVSVLRQFIAATAPLNPSAYVLHLPRQPGASGQWPGGPSWPQLAIIGIRKLMDGRVSSERIAVETLDYPLDAVLPVIRDLDLRICLDVGHLICRNQDPVRFYHRHQSRISMIHLHGVCGGQDHQELSRLPEATARGMTQILRGFSGVLTLELFSYERLSRSLIALDRWLSGSKAAPAATG